MASADDSVTQNSSCKPDNERDSGIESQEPTPQPTPHCSEVIENDQIKSNGSLKSNNSQVKPSIVGKEIAVRSSQKPAPEKKTMDVNKDDHSYENTTLGKSQVNPSHMTKGKESRTEGDEVDNIYINEAFDERKLNDKEPKIKEDKDNVYINQAFNKTEELDDDSMYLSMSGKDEPAPSDVTYDDNYYETVKITDKKRLESIRKGDVSDVFDDKKPSPKRPIPTKRETKSKQKTPINKKSSKQENQAASIKAESGQKENLKIADKPEIQKVNKPVAIAKIPVLEDGGHYELHPWKLGLTIPPNALPASTPKTDLQISKLLDNNLLAQTPGVTLLSCVYELKPHGICFSESLTIKIPLFQQPDRKKTARLIYRQNTNVVYYPSKTTATVEENPDAPDIVWMTIKAQCVIFMDRFCEVVFAEDNDKDKEDTNDQDNATVANPEGELDSNRQKEATGSDSNTPSQGATPAGSNESASNTQLNTLQRMKTHSPDSPTLFINMFAIPVLKKSNGKLQFIVICQVERSGTAERARKSQILKTNVASKYFDSENRASEYEHYKYPMASKPLNTNEHTLQVRVLFEKDTFQEDKQEEESKGLTQELDIRKDSQGNFPYINFYLEEKDGLPKRDSATITMILEEECQTVKMGCFCFMKGQKDYRKVDELSSVLEKTKIEEFRQAAIKRNTYVTEDQGGETRGASQYSVVQPYENIDDPDQNKEEDETRDVGDIDFTEPGKGQLCQDPIPLSHATPSTSEPQEHDDRVIVSSSNTDPVEDDETLLKTGYETFTMVFPEGRPLNADEIVQEVKEMNDLSPAFRSSITHHVATELAKLSYETLTDIWDSSLYPDNPFYFSAGKQKMFSQFAIMTMLEADPNIESFKKLHLALQQKRCNEACNILKFEINKEIIRQQKSVFMDRLKCKRLEPYLSSAGLVTECEIQIMNVAGSTEEEHAQWLLEKVVLKLDRVKFNQFLKLLERDHKDLVKPLLL